MYGFWIADYMVWNLQIQFLAEFPRLHKFLQIFCRTKYKAYIDTKAKAMFNFQLLASGEFNHSESL